MEIIRHILSHARFPHPVVSIGNFDGVHVGHQEILRRVVQDTQARQGTSLVFTFHPHPLTVLRPDRPLPLILSLREKLSACFATGVHGVIVQRFTKAFSLLTAETFVQRHLVEAIGVEKVIVGHNVSFGHNRTGRAETLLQFGARYGFAVEVVGPVMVNNQEVSSTAVRAALSTGDMQTATRLLGRPYAVSGRVEKGFQRGRTIGFPTANLRPRADLLLPNGVYAVRVEVGDTHVPGVANVGVTPTFGVNKRTIEAHLFDFSADLYGQRVRVSFIEHLRGEQKFPSIQELVRQIHHDAQQARAILKHGESLSSSTSVIA
ncbi:MAG: bifunctional riboflavin kinase/FAD synthetase [Deltaproteobacteria bacterium]|nr:bifunctional riboflavin kinase/FAD synthetase [Deltaproteobacteria bacterium]